MHADGVRPIDALGRISELLSPLSDDGWAALFLWMSGSNQRGDLRCAIFNSPQGRSALAGLCVKIRELDLARYRGDDSMLGRAAVEAIESELFAATVLCNHVPLGEPPESSG